jgi:hypothetical protein
MLPQKIDYPFAGTIEGDFSKSAKRCFVQPPGVECPKVARPYECEWRPAYLNDRTG